MAQLNAFKQYARGSRNQLTEEKFSSGMYYTNLPLPEGAVRTLVNMDITAAGKSLKARPGLRAIQKAELPEVVENIPVSSEYKIITNKLCGVPDGKEYDQVIVCNKNNTLQILTIDDAGTQKFSERAATAKTILPDKAEIHGLPVSESLVKDVVGTFAWNNSYHFFNTTGDLCYTTFDETAKQFNIHETGLVPEQPTAAEAQLWGFNMLLTEPYAFGIPAVNDNPVEFTGIMMYDTNNNPVVSPKKNKKYTYKIYTNGGKCEGSIVIAWKEPAGSTWNPIKRITDYAAGTAIEISFASPADSIIVKVTAYNTTTGAEGDVDTISSVRALTVNFDQEATNIEAKTYTLGTATCMAYFKQRIWLAGVEQDKTILFASQPNKAEYFPYPNNVTFFEDPIVDLVPYLDTLLVFTTSGIYQIKMNEDGMSWTTSCIQENLFIMPWDRHLTQVVKNLVFFKSGNYYYMVVPKANAVTGTLTLAPITNNIKDLLDNFQESIDKLLQEMYNFTEDKKLIHYYNFLDYENIHNIYVFETQNKTYINIDLIYNSVVRYWKLNIYESNSFIMPNANNATQPGRFCSLCFDNYVPVVQYLKFDETNNEDCYYNSSSILTNSTRFKNYQYLDTGFREHNTQLKKRYRELQFNIENPAGSSLKLYTGFFIDNDARRSYFKYVPYIDVDTNTILINQELADPIEVPSYTYLDTWELDYSVFPADVLPKIRIPVSGKGYAPRLIFVSYNEKPFLLQQMSWVYRTLNSR